jgi:hypothetical protein
MLLIFLLPILSSPPFCSSCAYNFSCGLKKDISKTYNEYKEFEGKQYTVNKKRAGHAPEGSGVPVGTEYNWYILAYQNVKKLDANSYSTSMTGLKYKLAHKRAENEKWSATDNTQRKRLIQVLEELIGQLKKEMVEPAK